MIPQTNNVDSLRLYKLSYGLELGAWDDEDDEFMVLFAVVEMMVVLGADVVKEGVKRDFLVHGGDGIIPAVQNTCFI